MDTHEAPTVSPITKTIRIMVNSLYSAQKSRIMAGNRITDNFKSKLGLKDDALTDKQKEKEEAKILAKLTKAYSRITDAVAVEISSGDANVSYIDAKRKVTPKNFKGDELITEYYEFLLANSYISFLNMEARLVHDLNYMLNQCTLYTNYLQNVDGVGPQMAAILIAYTDPYKTKYPSGLHRLAGLDVIRYGVYLDKEGKEHVIRAYDLEMWYADPTNAGKEMYVGKQKVEIRYEGRSRKDQSLVKREYTDKDGNVKERDSITFNPFLKTKLIGVLGTSFLRAGRSLVDGKKCGAAARLALAVKEGFDPEAYDSDEVQAKVIEFLRREGHDVLIERTKYGQIYVNYKARLEARPDLAEYSALHKHNMAIRYAVKQFLNEFYVAMRTDVGMSVHPPYHEAKLGLHHGQDL